MRIRLKEKLKIIKKKMNYDIVNGALIVKNKKSDRD